MKPSPRLALLSASLLLPGLASAATLTFDTGADYDDNFYELTNPLNLSWSANGGGILEKSLGNSATVALFNTTATGGVNGSGGTSAATLNNDTFVNLTLQADFRTPALAASGDSLGFFTKVAADAVAGYFTVFRMTGASSADFRVFDSTGLNVSTGALPMTPAFTGSFTGIPANTFAINTFFTFKLEVLDIAGGVQFIGSIFSTSGDAIGNPISYTDTSAPRFGPGQVAMRFGSATTSLTAYDNITIVPEPSTLAILGLAAIPTFLRRRRHPAPPTA